MALVRETEEWGLSGCIEFDDVPNRGKLFNESASIEGDASPREMRWTRVLMDSAVPFGLAAAGLLAGLVAECSVLPRLQRSAVSRRWVGGELLITALRGVTFALFLISGIYAALLVMPLPPANVTILHKGFLVALVPLATIVLARITGSLVSTYSRGL
jgi:hypothetical protein